MQTPARSCIDLLAERRSRPTVGPASLIRFAGVGPRDVYNIASPFEAGGRTIIAGRVERREEELAEILFFAEGADGVWTPLAGTPDLGGLQDPCWAWVDGRLVVGGVRWPIEQADGRRIWRMEFYSGSSPEDLSLLFVGPDMMKDIRLGPAPGGRVAVFSRPQGQRGGRGAIGLAVVDALEAVDADVIDAAPLLPARFLPEEWGGANQSFLLPDGRLGVLGHIARIGPEDALHYYPMAFTVDPETLESSPVRVLAERADFPPGPAKLPRIADVVFAGGLHRRGDGSARLYAGLSDAAAGWLEIADPFVGA